MTAATPEISAVVDRASEAVQQADKQPVPESAQGQGHEKGAAQADAQHLRRRPQSPGEARR
jgi:hypothetical protein